MARLFCFTRMLRRAAQVYLSRSTSPSFNLTLEEHLFRTRPADAPLCLIYRNTPCVVLGRNQNPWKDVNLNASKHMNIPFIRRRSGGGTVYHVMSSLIYYLLVHERCIGSRQHELLHSSSPDVF